MAFEPKSMDPERLAALKRSVERRDGDWREMLMEPEQVAELLADRDYCAQQWADALNENSRRSHKHYEAMKTAAEALAKQQEEIERLRARVRVEAEDVERAGITRAHVEAWLTANNWAPSKGHGSVPQEGRFSNWATKPSRECVSVFEDHNPARIAHAICTLARHYKRPGLDILDEMAAWRCPSE